MFCVRGMWTQAWCPFWIQRRRLGISVILRTWQRKHWKNMAFLSALISFQWPIPWRRYYLSSISPSLFPVVLFCRTDDVAKAFLTLVTDESKEGEVIFVDTDGVKTVPPPGRPSQELPNSFWFMGLVFRNLMRHYVFGCIWDDGFAFELELSAYHDFENKKLKPWRAEMKRNEICFIHFSDYEVTQYMIVH